MPKNVTKSPLMAKYGEKLRKAHEQHRLDETEYSQFGELPAGIENGIAQLVACKFDQYKKGDQVGQWYFYAAGIVKMPVEVDGIPVQGLRTTIIEPLGDTPTRTRKTTDEHVAWVYNELRKLGVDTTTMEFEDLEVTVDALQKASPHFRFRTWKGEVQTTGQYAGKEPRTNHQWNGVVDFIEGDGGGLGGVEDTSPAGPAPAASANGAGAGGTRVPAKAPASRTATRAAAPPPPPANKPLPTPEESFDDQGGLTDLAARAQAQDDEAQAELTTLAIQAGYTEAEVDGVDLWEQVVEMIENPRAANGTQEDGPAAPDKGDIVMYAPADPKNKKKTLKAVECEITAVDVEAQTVQLRNNTNRKVTYADVPWESLVASE